MMYEKTEKNKGFIIQWPILVEKSEDDDDEEDNDDDDVETAHY
jgi:hypothetical protein